MVHIRFSCLIPLFFNQLDTKGVFNCPDWNNRVGCYFGSLANVNSVHLGVDVLVLISPASSLVATAQRD